MRAVLIQNALDSMVNRCRRCQNAAGHCLSNELRLNDQLDLNLVDICLANALQILCKSLLCFQKFGRLTDYSKIAKNLTGKVLNVQIRIVYLTKFSTDFNNLGLQI